MRILIRNVEATPQRRALRQLVVRETGLVMRRLRWLLPRVSVELSQVDAATTGDVNKRCVVELKTRRIDKVVVTALARDWRTAMQAALRLASRRLSELRQSTAKPLRVQLAAAAPRTPQAPIR